MEISACVCSCWLWGSVAMGLMSWLQWRDTVLPWASRTAAPTRSPPALGSCISLASKADSVLTRAAIWSYLLLLLDIQNKQRLRSFHPLPYVVLRAGMVLVLGPGSPHGDQYPPGSAGNDKSPGMGNAFQLSPNLFSLRGRASWRERLVGRSGLNSATQPSPVLLHK